MEGGIYLDDDGKLIEMTEHKYSEERVLQEQLAEYPRLLAGDQMHANAPREWMLIAREADIPDHKGGGGRWSADHLFIDQDAVPTLVEVKRSSDTRIRREVVGQALDYISHACNTWDADTLETQFTETWTARGEDPNEVLADTLDDESAGKFWQQAESNLRSKHVRILFVADEVPSELKRVVEFLNEGFTDVEVFAIEVAQYRGDGMNAFVPRLYGQTEEARGKKSSRYEGTIGNEDEFFEDIRNKRASGEVSEELAEAFIDLYEFAKGLGTIEINRTKNAAFKLIVDAHQGDAPGNPGVFTANINGSFKMLHGKNPLPDGPDEPKQVDWSEDVYDTYRDGFDRLSEVDGQSRPGVETLLVAENLERFKTITEEFVSNCKEAARTAEERK